jgi:hypothetical protein
MRLDDEIGMRKFAFDLHEKCGCGFRFRSALGRQVIATDACIAQPCVLCVLRVAGCGLGGFFNEVLMNVALCAWIRKDQGSLCYLSTRALSLLAVGVLVATCAACGKVAGTSNAAGTADGAAGGTSSSGSSSSGSSAASGNGSSGNGGLSGGGTSAESGSSSGGSGAAGASTAGAGAGATGGNNSQGGGGNPALDSGIACGGPDGMSCDPPEWCDFPGGGCGLTGQWGECRPSDYGSNPSDGNRVCGCDGRVYPNATAAHALGITTTDSTSCVQGDAGVLGSPCIMDANCQVGFKCCDSGGTSSPLKCTPAAAGMCPMRP